MLIVHLFAKLPLSVLYGLSNFLAWILADVVRYRRKVILQNLRHAFPYKNEKELKNIARSFYRGFIDVWIEAIKSLEMNRERFSQHIEIKNPELLLEYVNKKQSVLVLTAHFANWEWLLLGFCANMTVQVDAAYQSVNNSFFNKLMLDIRSRYGAHMIEKAQVLRETIKRARVPRVLAMVADQKPQKSANRLWTPFMHRPAPFFTAAEKMARKLNMPVFYADMKRTQRGQYQVEFILLDSPPFSSKMNDITRRYITCIEKAIQEKPEQYLWSHKRWKHKPPADWSKGDTTNSMDPQ